MTRSNLRNHDRKTDSENAQVGAFLRPATGSQIQKKRLFDYLRQHLSPQKTPALWFVVDEFPLTGSGKIQKFVLRKQWEDGEHKEL